MSSYCSWWSFCRVLLVYSLFLTPGLICRAVAQENFASKHGSFFHLYSADRAEGAFTYRFVSDQEEDGGSGKYDLHVFGAKAELPRPMDDDFYLRLGGEFNARKYEFASDGGRFREDNSRTLYKTVLRGGAGWFLGEDVLLTGVAEGGGYSDYEDSPDEDDLQLHGEGFLIFRVNPGAQIVFGVKESNDLEDYSVFPLFGVRLLSEDGRFHLSVTAPLEARVGYSISPEFQLYAGGWISGDEYRIALREGSSEVFQQDRLIGLGMNYWLGSHVNLRVEGGASVESKLEYKADFAREFSGGLDYAPYVGGALSFAL
jgi:hypothetical protein